MHPPVIACIVFGKHNFDLAATTKFNDAAADDDDDVRVVDRAPAI